MPIVRTIKRWLRNLFRKERRKDLLSGVSATPDFPDPTSLITWILMSYRHRIDRYACFSLEYIQDPFICIQYDKPVKIFVRYSPPFSPTERLKAIGLPLPDGFSLAEWKRHDHFILTGPWLPPGEMATFLNSLFQKLYRAKKGYVMAAWTDIYPTTKVPHHPTQKKALRQDKANP
ncbi:hypothetical protein [Desulfoluna sp.]|uniref:hypothetical protein n=1 Tax=Desulfoluna sp. TaxID=2045199 RepID=UPI0026117E94|nr:hypothetical protein [Desulfoluna sp.]